MPISRGWTPITDVATLTGGRRRRAGSDVERTKDLLQTQCKGESLQGAFYPDCAGGGEGAISVPRDARDEVDAVAVATSCCHGPGACRTSIKLSTRHELRSSELRIDNFHMRTTPALD